MVAMHYAKFFLVHLVGWFALTCILAGGHWMTFGLVAVALFYVIGDAMLGDDLSEPNFQHARIMTFILWLSLPLLILITFAFVWAVSAGDFAGFGSWLSNIIGYDLLQAKRDSAWFHSVFGALLTGLMIGILGTVTGHELTHRTWDPTSMAIGRWLLAFSFDSAFSIEHVYGHHRYVATTVDPATAPRGRNVYTHIVISTIKGNLSAWRIECARLQKRKLAIWSWHNAFLTGYIMSLALTGVAYYIGGLEATFYFLLAALAGKALLEIVNYLEHYGMVRDPNTPVQPHHSWNTNKKLSSWALFNLCRHSHHHAQGEVPYHALKPLPEAPQMIGGYLTTIGIALIPPLWHKLMTPKVLDWDRRYASAVEKDLAIEASLQSGIKAFVDEAKQSIGEHT